MKPSFERDGYEIHRDVLDHSSVLELRQEADAIAGAAGSTCVRHLRSRSSRMKLLSTSEAFISLLPPGMIPVRSILFDKTPESNWPVLWHQDLTIAVAAENEIPGYGPWSFKDGSPHVQPPAGLLKKMVTLRLHLDETTSSNGALRVIPGSHRLGKIPSEKVANHSQEDFVTCQCSPGDILLMSPLILHSSLRSASPSRRRVIHFEYARPDDLHPDLSWFE